MSNEKICAVEPSQKRACVEPFDIQFLNACKEGDFQSVVSLAKDVQALTDAQRDKKYFNYKALRRACSSGKLEVVKYLCEELGFDPIKHDEPREPIILYACGFGHLDVVKYLHESRKVSLESKSDKGMSVLTSACGNGREAVVDYLLASCQLTIADICDGYRYAVHYQKTGCVDYLWNKINSLDLEKQVYFCKYVLNAKCDDPRLTQLLENLLNRDVEEVWQMVAEYSEINRNGWVSEFILKNHPTMNKVFKFFPLKLVKFFIKQLKFTLANFGDQALSLFVCAAENPDPRVKVCLFELACKQGHLEGVKYLYDLISKDSPLLILDDPDASLLDNCLKIACFYDHLEVANFLFNKLFSKPNGWGIILDSGYCQLANKNKVSEIRFLTKLYNEAMQVDNDGSNSAVTKKNLAPLLDYAYNSDDILAAKYLFQLACEQGWLDEVQNLYDKVSKDSPQLDFTTSRIEDEETNCFKLACENEHVEVAKFLFEKLFNTIGGWEPIVRSSYYEIIGITGLNKIEHLIKLYDRAKELGFDPEEELGPGFYIFKKILRILEVFTELNDHESLRHYEAGVKLCDEKIKSLMPEYRSDILYHFAQRRESSPRLTIFIAKTIIEYTYLYVYKILDDNYFIADNNPDSTTRFVKEATDSLLYSQKLSKAYIAIGDYKNGYDWALKSVQLRVRVCNLPFYTGNEDYLTRYDDSSEFLRYVEKSALGLIKEYQNDYKYSATLQILKEIVLLAASLPDSMLIDGNFGKLFFALQPGDNQGRNKIDSLCLDLNSIFSKYPTIAGSCRDIVELYRAIFYIFNAQENESDKGYDLIRRMMALCLNSDPTLFDENLKAAIRLFLGVLHKVIDVTQNDKKLVASLNVNLVSYFSSKENVDNFNAQSQPLSQKLFSLRSDAFLQVVRLTQNQAQTLQKQAKALEALGLFIQPPKHDANDNPLPNCADEEPISKRSKNDGG